MTVRMPLTFWRVLLVGILAALLSPDGITGLRARAKRLTTNAGAAAKTAVLLLKVYPMLPSRPLDWVTPRPVVERFRYPTSRGPAEGDLYRPSGPGPHPAVASPTGTSRSRLAWRQQTLAAPYLPHVGAFSDHAFRSSRGRNA
jgi:hypothetical protein